MPKKIIKARLDKVCSCCGKAIRVIMYSKSDYRGGHFFGTIPLHTKKAMREADKAGYTEEKLGTLTVRVMKKDPVAYKHVEYWECPKCYWRG